MRNKSLSSGLPRGGERCADIVRRWLTTCNKGSCYYVVHMFADFSDEQLADRCISCWRLDQPQGDDNDITWFEQHDADRQTLIAAFAAARASLAHGI